MKQRMDVIGRPCNTKTSASEAFTGLLGSGRGVIVPEGFRWHGALTKRRYDSTGIYSDAAIFIAYKTRMKKVYKRKGWVKKFSLNRKADPLIL